MGRLFCPASCWAAVSAKPTGWAPFTVEPTDLQMGYLHCLPYWPTDGQHSLSNLLTYWWRATFSAEPTDELPSLSSHWWATYSVKPTDGLPPLLSLLMDYLHWIAYWWATYIAQYLYTSLNVLNYTSQGIWCFSFIFVDRETRNFTLTYLQSVVVPEQCLSPRPCLLIQYLIGSCTENCIACCAYNLPPPPPQYILFVP